MWLIPSTRTLIQCMYIAITVRNIHWRQYTNSKSEHLHSYNNHYSQCFTGTLVMVADLILPVCRTCGPRQRSMRGPHLETMVVRGEMDICGAYLYTVVVGVVTLSLIRRHLNWLYWRGDRGNEALHTHTHTHTHTPHTTHTPWTFPASPLSSSQAWDKLKHHNISTCIVNNESTAGADASVEAIDMNWDMKLSWHWWEMIGRDRC